MAFRIVDFPNTSAISGAEPYGNIKDDTGSNDGTPVDKQVYADKHQFFAWLMDKAGVTPNSLPDNLTNGFQLGEALLILTDRYRCTSTTSVAIGSVYGTVVAFTVPDNLDYYTGTWVRISDAANPSSNFMIGFVVSYTTSAGVGTLNVLIERVAGTGTFTNWIISLSAPNAIQVDNSIQLRTKVVEIGDWDMDADSSVPVAHGIADFTKIREITAMIRDDADIARTPLNAFSSVSGLIGGGVLQAGATTVILDRLTGGGFDSTNFNSTGFNRGWITITYTV
jgi:hypothetical protein